MTRALVPVGVTSLVRTFMDTGPGGAVARETLRRALKTSPKRLPPAATVAFQSQARVGKSNARLYRSWAEHSEWVRSAINIRKSQVSQSEWDIGPYDPDREYPRRLAQRLRKMFMDPNARGDSFRTFMEQVVEDILVLDAGCVEIVQSLRGEPVELWPTNGGDIRVSSLWDGDPEEARYFWYPDHQERARFKNDEMIYMMLNPRTYTPVGLSPLETLKMTIDAELSGHAYNTRQVQNAAPDGMIDLGESARSEQVDAFKLYWDQEIAGRGAMAILGGSKGAKFQAFRASNRDMQFLEWQIYLVRKIAAVFQLTPQDLGVTYDVNRSTSEVQAEQSEDRGLRPLLGLIQDHFTREVVWHPAFGGPDNNLAFRFTRLNMKESADRAEINRKALAGMPWKTVDEARRDEGREPLGGPYSLLMANTSRGLVTLDDIPSAREVFAGDSGSGGGEEGSSESARPASEPADRD
jgi:HK97 family phage portal protein